MIEPTCENCGCQHQGTYASGRFCGPTCSRGFSTKAKRREINESLRAHAQKHNPTTWLQRRCQHCGNAFQVPLKRKKAEFCSVSCATSHRMQDPLARENLSGHRIAAIKNGKENHRSIRCVYLFNGTAIRCDSKLEYTCLDWFERTYEVVSMARNTVSIRYLFEGFEHRFLPDFRICTSDGAFLVEVKGVVPEGYLNEKWRKYRENAIPKQAALEEYALREGLTPLWFTMGMHRKFYRSVKL